MADRDLDREIAKAGANADRAHEKVDLQRDKLARMAGNDPRRPTEEAILDSMMRSADAADLNRSLAQGEESLSHRQPVDMQVIRDLEQALMTPVQQARHKRPEEPFKKTKDLLRREPLAQPRGKPKDE